MSKKSLGKLQILLGCIAILMCVGSTIIDLMVGGSILEFLIKAPLPLLFGLFAIFTGMQNLKHNNG